MQVDPSKPTFKAPGTKRLKLKCVEPLSKFAFKFNLRRYTLSFYVMLDIAPQLVTKLQAHREGKKASLVRQKTQKRKKVEAKKRKKEGLKVEEKALSLTVQAMIFKFVQRVLVSKQAGAYTRPLFSST